MTSVVWNDGSVHEKSTEDPIIGHSIIGNIDGPISKIADGSTRDPEIFTIFGMQFGIKWNEETALPEPKDIAFHGDMARCVATQFVWRRIPCYTSENHGENPYQGSIRASVQFASTVKVKWYSLQKPNSKSGEKSRSEVLEELKCKVPDDSLFSIRITLFYTTRRFLPYLPYNGTLGYMVGSIGVHETYPHDSSKVDSTKIYDTYNIQGKRALFTKGSPINLKFPRDDDICGGLSKEEIKQESWINFAPFEVVANNEKFQVQLDLSNSIPTNLHNTLRDIGELQLGAVTPTCVKLLGKLDYTSEDNLYVRSGFHVVENSENLINDQLVIVQVVHGTPGSSKICNSRSDHLTAQILLQEESYYVRPMKYYNDFLEKGYVDSSTQQIYVKPCVRSLSESDFGPPNNGVTVKQKAVRYYRQFWTCSADF